MKYFAIFVKNVATIFQLQWIIGNISDMLLQYSVLCVLNAIIHSWSSITWELQKAQIEGWGVKVRDARVLTGYSAGCKLMVNPCATRVVGLRVLHAWCMSGVCVGVKSFQPLSLTHFYYGSLVLIAILFWPPPPPPFCALKRRSWSFRRKP